MQQIVLGRQHGADFAFPAGIMESKHGSEIAPVDGHARACIVLGAHPLEPRGGPGVGPTVLPGDGGAEGSLFAEAHERRQLTGESDRSDALRPIRIARAQFPIERSHGSARRLEPVARRLLGLMRQRGVGGEIRGPLAHQAAQWPGLHRRHLDGRGSQVDAEHQTHGLHVLGEAAGHDVGRLQRALYIVVGVREGHE